MYCLEDCIAFITNKVIKELSDNLEKRLNVYNITKTQWMTLYYIKLNPGISQKSLSDLLVLKESSVVRQLDKMEVLGWVKRNPSEMDRRIKILSLTKLGEEIEVSMEEIVKEFKSDVTNNINDEKLEVFREVLDKMVLNVKNKA